VDRLTRQTVNGGTDSKWDGGNRQSKKETQDLEGRLQELAHRTADQG